jgi:hypothetical protein
MSLGNFNQNYNNSTEDNNKKNYDPTVFSPIQFKNPIGVDPSMISIAFWRGMMKISISPKMDPKPGDKFDTYDHKNNIAIHINHMKARMLYNEISAFMEGKLNSVGVNSGVSGLITISNGLEFGINSPVLVIRKMDESGKVNSSYAYQFNANDYYTTIRNFDEKTLKYDTVNCPNLELLVFQDTLKNYYESASYAGAAMVVDALKFDNSRINTKLDLLLDNAGIKRQGGGNGGNGGKSFFQRSSELDSDNSTASSRNTTLDDLASDIEG